MPSADNSGSVERCPAGDGFYGRCVLPFDHEGPHSATLVTTPATRVDIMNDGSVRFDDVPQPVTPPNRDVVLTQREGAILSMRIDQHLSLSEIGSAVAGRFGWGPHGISRERVRQITGTALAKLGGALRDEPMHECISCGFVAYNRPDWLVHSCREDVVLDGH